MREHSEATNAAANSQVVTRPWAMGDRMAELRHGAGVVVLSVAVFLGGCATVKVQAPDKPIEINLNVKIEQEVRVRLDRDIEDLIASNPDIF